MIFDDDGSVWFRQSWLDTALRCGERGRQAIVRPDWDEITSDAALIGTATHTAIEGYLNGNVDATAIGATAASAAIALTAEPVKWTKWSTPKELADHAARCAEGWLTGIAPEVTPGGATEVSFKVPLFNRADGRLVGIQGTIDYIDPNGDMWDWKTSSGPYKPRDKQRTAVQPTVYAVALIKGGLSSVVVEYPVRFRFGIAIRGEKQAKPQIVEVQRTKAHEGWLFDHLNTFVTMAERLGLDESWPRDDDHFLCSEKWCPWWSVCKGARLSTADDHWSSV